MHVAKYTSSQMGQMLTHYNRNNGEDRNYSNENIDKSKTEQNYNLAPERDCTEVEYINQRLDEVKHLNRKDTIKLADWVVTLPQDYEGSQKAFFEQSYKALENRYGRENVVSAYVHLDEKQPHMHFAFMPICRTVDRNGHDIEKLSAKEVLTRQELREMHPYMERCLERNHIHAHLLNEQTRDGNKAIKELKRDTAIKDLERVRELEQIKDKQIEPVSPRKGLKGLYVPYEQYKQDIEKLNSQLYDKQKEVSASHQRENSLVDRLDRAERTAHEEHEERLRLQDKLHDKDYLKQRVRELEREEQQHEHEHTHSRTVSRDR